MSLHPTTLLAAAFAALGMGVVAMALFGTTHRVYRGFWWWSGAQAMFLAGLGLQLGFGDSPWALRVAGLLMLQWPVVLLVGMRRFQARSALRGSATLDGAMFAWAIVVWLATAVAGETAGWEAVGFAVAAAALHAYAVAVQWRLVAEGRAIALATLLVLQALTAAAFAARAMQALFQHDLALPPETSALGAGLVGTITALATAWLALLLTHERTEANLTASHRKLRYLADIDVLTRIPNRRHFHELAERWVGQPDAGQAALMMFDIDHFKRINDLLGHAIGDEAIRQVSHCIRESLREPDIAGRLGGDEFAVLLPQTSVADAMGVAQRISIRLQDRQVAPRSAPLSLSFGVVALQPGEALADALRRADQALYEAKRQGRQRAVVAQGPESRPVFTESRPLGWSAP